MSYLREIMQRFQAARSADTASGAEPAGEATARSEADRRRLEDHLALYRDRLLACTPAMLRYEWAWLEEHIEALELCRCRPEMVGGAAGAARVGMLLEESLRFRDLLRQRMAAAAVEPARHRGTLVASEHAWELRQPEIRRQWGIEASEGAPVPPDSPGGPHP